MEIEERIAFRRDLCNVKYINVLYVVFYRTLSTDWHNYIRMKIVGCLCRNMQESKVLQILIIILIIIYDEKDKSYPI